MYYSFFGGYPEYQKKFRGFADVPLEKLAENKRLQAHAFTVLNAINGLVDNLDDPDVLNVLLHKTGQNHGGKRNLKRGDFEVSDFTYFMTIIKTRGFTTRIHKNGHRTGH